MATVFSNKKTKSVSNLGWLLRYRHEVISFEFHYIQTNNGDGKLIANLQDGRQFISDFASLVVCFIWLSRPSFKSLPLVVIKEKLIKSFIIGDEWWIKLNKLTYYLFLHFTTGIEIKFLSLCCNAISTPKSKEQMLIGKCSVCGSDGVNLHFPQATQLGSMESIKLLPEKYLNELIRDTFSLGVKRKTLND